MINDNIANKAMKRFISKYGINKACGRTNEDTMEICGKEVLLSWGNRWLEIFVGDNEEPWTWAVDIYGNEKILVSC